MFELTYRLLKENGLLVDVKRYKATRVAQREKIRAKKVNKVWGTDMTKFYVDTVGWLYFVVVLDWYTKKIVGWDLSLRSKAEQWMDALNQAIEKELTEGSREYGLVLISDNGSQPTSIKYENLCNTLGINHITTSYSNTKGTLISLSERQVPKDFLGRSKKKLFGPEIMTSSMRLKNLLKIV